MNGNGAARGGAVKDESTKENIFMFYPNLIGKCGIIHLAGLF